MVQVDATRDVVRIVNTCSGDIDVSDLQVCGGTAQYAERCVPLPVDVLDGSACVEMPLTMPHDVATAFGVGLFGAGADPKTSAPLDNYVFGPANTAHVDADGVVRKPHAPSLPPGTAATWGRHRWWYRVPSAPVPISCDTWAHRIIVEDVQSCDPQLVEVHPGRGSSYVKLALQPRCEPVALQGLSLDLGVDAPVITLPLPAVTLQPGRQLVIGDPSTSAESGWAQWGWPDMHAVGWQSLGLLEQDRGVVVLRKAGEILGGVSWGATTFQGVFQWGAPPVGRSLVWRGDQWRLGVASPNQLPRWLVLDAEL